MHTAAQARRVAGLTYRQLDTLARLGIVEARWPAQGKGSRRYYDAADLLALRVAARLRTTGLSLSQVQGAVHALRESGIGQERFFVAQVSGRIAIVRTEALVQHAHEMDWAVAIDPQEKI